MHGPIYILLFGLVFFGIGAGLTYSQRSFERAGAVTEGDVVSMVTSCDDDGCSDAPVVRFTTQAGQAVTFETSYFSSPPAYHIGQRVTVVYSLEEPEKAVIQGQGQLFRIIFMAVGGLIIAFGLVMFSSNLRDSIIAG
jgi:hypothetical protein